MSREIEAAADELSRAQVKAERALKRQLDIETREITALLITNIAMGQAGLMILNNAMRDLPVNRMITNLKGRQKQAFNTAIKAMRTAKGCLADADTMQEEFTASMAIEPEEQKQIAIDMLTNYHEIAELVSLYMNAYLANPEIMRILRPILIGQSKTDTNGIRPETISRYRQM